MNQNSLTDSSSSEASTASDTPLQEKEIDLFEHLTVFVRWRWIILRNMLMAAALATAVSFLIPPRYTATTTLLPSEDNSSGAGLSALLGDSPLAGLALGQIKSGTSADLFVELLQSRTVMDAVIDELDLMKVYEVDNKELARQQLKGEISVSASDAGMVTLRTEAGTPELAAHKARLFVSNLEQVNQNKNISRAKSTRVFIEKRFEQAREDLRNAEEALLAFQTKNKTVSIEEQTKATIEAAVQLKTELVTREIERNILQKSLNPRHPRIQELQAQIDELDRQLRQIEQGSLRRISDEKRGSSKEGIASPTDFYPPIEAIPSLALDYIRLYREVKVQNAIYELVLQQYEQARIQEARDTPTVEVMDEAIPPEIKSWPKKIYIILASVMVTLILSTLYAFVTEYFRKLNQQEEQRKQLQSLIEPIKTDFLRIKFWR